MIRSGFGPSGHVAAAGRGIALIVFGSLLLTANDAVMKAMTATYPIGQMIALRGLFGMLVLAVVMPRFGGFSLLRTRSPKAQAGRALLMTASTACFVTGLSLLPLADAIAVAFAGPVFVAALAGPLLSERVGWRRWLAVLIGFGAVLLIAQPGGAGWNWAYLFPLAATLGGALRDIITRRITAHDSSLTTLFYSTAVVTLGGCATLPFGWLPPAWGDLAWLALSGPLLMGAHFCHIEAFRFGEASALSPFKYSTLIWGILLGWLVFSQLPGSHVVIGALLLVVCGLYIQHRERRAGGSRH